MYIPNSFREDSTETLHALMRAYPLGLLVSGCGDALQASPVPFLTYADEGGFGVLRAHMARANPHWQALRGMAECLVVFQGPSGYVTPSWYPGKAETHKVVPTWNYAMVQAWGKPAVIEDEAWLRRQLDDLTRQHEQDRPQPWSVDDAPAAFIANQMKAIVGIEIPIARLDGKFKMSQNRADADRAGVVAGVGDPDDVHGNPPLAAWMRRTIS